MGMDAYIDRVRKPIIKENGRRDYEERIQCCYWRKNYGLLAIMRYSDDDYGQDVSLTKDTAEEILDYLCHNRDYFGGFQTVPDVCELLDMWDEYVDDGWKFVFNSNW